jgi:hypothetical protein
MVRMAVLMGLWVLMGGVIGFVLANNLINWMEGRPIHDGH